jgi:Kef-type K+ transport system membrane component KefB
MTADSIFTELSLVIAIAAGMALIMRLIRQPLMIGHILTGIIVGPSVFHVVKTPQTIETFSNIGIALLLFIIGLGLNPRVIREVGKVASLTGLFQVGITALLGWCGALLLGLNERSAILTGLALSFSSTIIILKLLNDKKEQSRLYGKIAIGLLIIQDLLAMVALLLVSAQKGSGGISSHQLLLLLCKGVLIGVPLFYIGNEVLPRLHKLIAGSQEFLFLFGIGWGFGAAALFAKAGFSIEVGALIAGVALASLPYAQEMTARLRPLRDFFVIVFFISLGTRLGFGSVGNLVPLIIFGSIVVIVLKPVIVMAIMGLLGYTKRTSFKTAVATGQVSEFSLVLILLANSQGLISGNLVAALTIVALITIAVSTYLMIYNDQLFQVFEKYLSLFERRKTHFEQESRHSYDLVLFGYSKGGHEFVKVFRTLHKHFVVIDYDPDIIDSLEHQKLDYLYGDAMDIELLEEAGLDKTKLLVSTIGDFATNIFLLTLLEKINPNCIVILHTETVEKALELYEHCATYVIMPHHIGSEKISSFIRRNGFKKSGFKDYREKHLAYLRLHYSSESDTSTATS